MTDLPDVVTATVQTIVSQSQALGLTWNLRLASITTISSRNLTVILDGDTATIGAINMCGTPLLAGDRVYVLMIPTSGNYVVGLNRTIGIAADTSGFAFNGSTNSGTFSAMPSNPQVTIFVSEGSSILLYMSVSAYSDTAGNSVQFGWNLNGTNYTAVHYTFGPTTGQHSNVSAQRLIIPTGLIRGYNTITGMWKLAGGAGNIFQDGNDWISMTALTCVAT